MTRLTSNWRWSTLRRPGLAFPRSSTPKKKRKKRHLAKYWVLGPAGTLTITLTLEKNASHAPTHSLSLRGDIVISSTQFPIFTTFSKRHIFLDACGEILPGAVQAR